MGISQLTAFCGIHGGQFYFCHKLSSRARITSSSSPWPFLALRSDQIGRTSHRYTTRPGCLPTLWVCPLPLRFYQYCDMQAAPSKALATLSAVDPHHPWSVALPYISSTQNCNRSTHLSRWKHFLRLSKVRYLHRARIPRVLSSMRAMPRLVKTGGRRGDLHRVEWLWGWLSPTVSKARTPPRCSVN